MDYREARNIAFSPPDVVSTLTKNVCSVITKWDLSIKAIIEPCAGDGRLAKAVETEVRRRSQSKAELLMFDLSPASDKVITGDVLDERFVGRIVKGLKERGTTCSLAIVNPPFSPAKRLHKIVSASLGIISVNICALVLPGRFSNAENLDTLLPPFFHVERISRVDNASFEQPVLRDFAKEMTVVIVVAVSKTYQRQLSSINARPVAFRFVKREENWHQAFRTGAIRRPVEVIDAGTTVPDAGCWVFVEYIGLNDDAEIEQLCEVVKTRTERMSGPKGSKRRKTNFPRCGTNGRFVTPKMALTEWLNHLIEDCAKDDMFYGGFCENTHFHADSQKKGCYSNH